MTTSDPQLVGVYAATSALAFGRELQTLEDAKEFIDGVTTDLGVAPITLAVVPPVERSFRANAAYADVQGRVINVEPPDEGGAMTLLLALHEIAHILTPTSAEPHGPAYVRTMLDLVDRYAPHLSAPLRVELRIRNVRTEPGPGRWATPHPWFSQAELNEQEGVVPPTS